MISNMAELLDLHEGTRSKPYRCSQGYLSIGRGRNLDAKGLRPDEIEYLFQNDLREAVEDALFLVPDLLDLDPVRAAVVIDMAFNMGRARLGKFRDFLRAVRAHEYDKAADEMVDSKWYHQVGGRVPAVERSERLEKMMRTGQWPEE